MPTTALEGSQSASRRQAKERLAAGQSWEDHDLVFCQRNGRPIHRTEDWKEWKHLLRLAKVRDVRVHDGRHTAATLLIEQGVRIRTVQKSSVTPEPRSPSDTRTSPHRWLGTQQNSWAKHYGSNSESRPHGARNKRHAPCAGRN
ncbi:tyrosine-type recombinase/integrase [Cryptosporangium sp. NPDC051539]|uniref:tyrosine-type recombinase/integrase n=1 Tax=Cryptosporangium sp. NPDC051539 TaxID=3363962 RepID=UPI003793F275